MSTFLELYRDGVRLSGRDFGGHGRSVLLLHGLAGHGEEWAETASGLERREDGWWPRFDAEVMAQTLRQALVAPSWQEWERISCPTLIVRGENGTVEPDTAAEMGRRLPGAQVVEIGGAGHDLHLDRPEAWRLALTGFLDSLG